MGQMFTITLGDSSGDGHGQREVFTIEVDGSNGPKTVADAQAAYIKAKKKLPKCICPENFLNEYEERSMSKKVYETALKHGYDFVGGEGLSEKALEDWLDHPDMWYEDMLNYMLWFIQQGDDTIALKVVDIPDFRHGQRPMDFIGYAFGS